MPATVTAKGQITIPKAVRDQLGVRPGSKVDFRRTVEGRVELFKLGTKAQSRFQKLRGSAGPGPTTDELMAMLRGDD